MNLPSQDLKDMILAESSLDLEFGKTLFIGIEPSAPSRVVTIYDTPGSPPLNTLIKGEEVWRPSVQIKVRNTSYVAAGDLINQIKDLLHLRAGETWGGSKYTLIECAQEPFCLGFDENNLVMWICNFLIERQ